ncbi:MAG: diacylglycerol kinase family protein [Bacilli bacterium]|nr:diacylglycerol kinase family protein [Bacilli bacterium]
MIYILFNPKADNGHGEDNAKAIAEKLKIQVKFQSVIDLNLKQFFDGLKKTDGVILTGGDGTLNRFVNDLAGHKPSNKISYARCGSGNDFYRDVVDHADEEGLIPLNRYIDKLPTVEINGKKTYFLNNIGFGLDGQCCEVADQIRATDPGAKINYTGIAIKLLLGKYKLRKATVEVDGKVSNYENVWLATTMHGRYYGGGMTGAPRQDRLNKAHTNDLVIFTGKSRLLTFLRFPKFSGGKHDKLGKHIHHIVGKDIKVTFDIPCALQIDGETVLGVTSYTIKTA